MIHRIRDISKALTFRLRARSDTEHVMSLNRAVFCIAMSAYIFALDLGPNWLGSSVLVGGLATTTFIFAHLVAFPKRNIKRQVVAVTADILTITGVLHFGGESAAIFFPLILWTIFGNGFRLGIVMLRISTLFAILGFTVMASVTPFWAENLSLSLGLGAGLLMVPAYASVLIRKLVQARARAEAASEAKSAFLANVSHELRTPLQAIIGSINLMEREADLPKVINLSRTALTASENLLSMINDLLDFAKIEAHEVNSSRVVFDVSVLLREVSDLVRPSSLEKHLTMRIHVDPSIPLHVEADRTHIRSILLNLAANAVKFTERGGILLAVRAEHHSLHGLCLRFEIVDTGIGVAPDARERIFDRFMQADSAISQRYGGTGLGLAICRTLATHLNGQIGVQSGIEPGSLFWLSVPVKTIGPASISTERSRAPVVLFYTNNYAVDRIASVSLKEGITVKCESSSEIEALRKISDSSGSGSIHMMPVPLNPLLLDQLRKLSCSSNQASSLPLILIAPTNICSPYFDLRWLAPVILPSDFTETQFRTAVALASTFAITPQLTQEVDCKHLRSKSFRILVADDNRTNQYVFSGILQSGGHECRIAGDGEQALDALANEEFDLVIMDVNMPVIDGIEATKLHRLAELGVARVPIIGLTADASVSMTERCRAAGMDRCLVKPISATDLLNAVEQSVSDFPQDRALTPSPHRDDPINDNEQQVDKQPLIGLANIGGAQFVNEVLEEFVRDVASLLGDINVALAQGDFTQVQFIGHSFASAASNVGALEIRRLGLKIESMSHDQLRSHGIGIVRDLKAAMGRFTSIVASWD